MGHRITIYLVVVIVLISVTSGSALASTLDLGDDGDGPPMSTTVSKPDPSTETVINPTAPCTLYYGPDHLAQLESYTDCMENYLDTGGFVFTANTVNTSQPLSYTIERIGGLEVPDIEFRDNDPDTEFQGRIVWFDSNEIPEGGGVSLEINGIVMNVPTAVGMSASEVKADLQSAILDAGFTLSSLLPLGVPVRSLHEVTVAEDPAGDSIHSLKFTSFDDGLISITLALEPSGL